MNFHGPEEGGLLMVQQWGSILTHPAPPRSAPHLPPPSLAVEVRDVLALPFPAGRRALLSLELLFP